MSESGPEAESSLSLANAYLDRAVRPINREILKYQEAIDWATGYGDDQGETESPEHLKHLIMQGEEKLQEEVEKLSQERSEVEEVRKLIMEGNSYLKKLFADSELILRKRTEVSKPEVKDT